MIHWNNTVLLLGQRRRRWTNTKQIFAGSLVFAKITQQTRGVGPVLLSYWTNVKDDWLINYNYVAKYAATPGKLFPATRNAYNFIQVISLAFLLLRYIVVPLDMKGVSATSQIVGCTLSYPRGRCIAAYNNWNLSRTNSTLDSLRCRPWLNSTSTEAYWWLLDVNFTHTKKIAIFWQNNYVSSEFRLRSSFKFITDASVFL